MTSDHLLVIDCFDAMNTALAVINRKAAITHTIESVPDDDTITIVTTHNAEKLLEYISHAHATRAIKFIKQHDVTHDDCSVLSMPDMTQFTGAPFAYACDGSTYFAGQTVIRDPGNMIDRHVTHAARLGNLVPPTKRKTSHFYSYEFVDGTPLCDMLTPQSISRFFSWCDANLWKRPGQGAYDLSEFHACCLTFYKDKTLESVSKIIERNQNVSDIVHYVNGTRTPKISDLLRRVDWRWLSLGAPARTHGNLRIENVIKTNEAYKLIDFRDDFATSVGVGDVYHDIAMFLGSILVPKKSLKYGLFSMVQSRPDRVVCSVTRDKIHDDCDDVLEKLVKSCAFDSKRVDVIQALTLFHAAARHRDPIDRLMFFVGKYLLTMALVEK